MWYRFRFGDLYHVLRCLEASAFGLAEVSEVCSSSGWSRTFVVVGCW